MKADLGLSGLKKENIILCNRLRCHLCHIRVYCKAYRLYAYSLICYALTCKAQIQISHIHLSMYIEIFLFLSSSAKACHIYTYLKSFPLVLLQAYSYNEHKRNVCFQTISSDEPGRISYMKGAEMIKLFSSMKKQWQHIYGKSGTDSAWA